MKWLVGVIAALIFSSPVCAQEFFALGGLLQKADSHDHSYSWQLEYLQGLSEHFAFGLTYLNEGHVPDHHRDGDGVQLWTRTSLLNRRLSLAAGIGPYYYFDTTKIPSADLHMDKHGLGAIFSLAATWYTPSGWLYKLRANWVETDKSIDTFSALVGIGYQLDFPRSQGPAATALPENGVTGNEITVFGGRSIINTFDSKSSTAAGVEYRRGLCRYIDWTASWLYEGDNGAIRKNGLITQLWAVRAFFEDRLTMGIGAGAYFAVDKRRELPGYEGGGDDPTSGIVTLTASYRFLPPWYIRVNWNRIITDSDLDADVILVGLGYAF